MADFPRDKGHLQIFAPFVDYFASFGIQTQHSVSPDGSPVTLLIHIRVIECFSIPYAIHSVKHNHVARFVKAYGCDGAQFLLIIWPCVLIDIRWKP